ncbi:MAG TPA: transcription termination factor NusA [Gemmatimonadota bacterium]|nr:transcription termination factor NusA [Gemmatimonadota bacterium]
MAMEIIDAFGQLTREKAIDKSEVIELVKAGMLAAVRRNHGAEANADILVDPASGEISIYLLKEVVEDEEQLEDPSRQMTVEEAKALPYVNEPWGDGEPQPGQIAEIPLDFRKFGRNAIQAAKQMIIQKVREEERNRIREEYEDRVGELVSGTVQQVDRGNALVFLDRRTEAIMPAREQVRREYLRQGETVRALLLDIKESTKGPQLILSRTHPDFVKALFALEVPEVFQGIVEIRAIAREPGSRSKIAVWSRDQHVDPVGACVGLKGSRVQAVVSELGGERIDIVPWTDDPRQFIAQSLSPADVYKIILHEREGMDDGGLFSELRGSPFQAQTKPRFRGPTAAPAPFQPASPEETAAALEASKAARARREARKEEAAEESRAAAAAAAETPVAEAGVSEPVDEPETEPGSGAEPESETEETAERPAEKRATVVCAEDQLSLAIGRSGQNVRLASKLTGYKIDLVSKQEYLAKEEEILFGRKPEPTEAARAVAEAGAGGEDFPLSEVPGVTPEAVAALTAAGYGTFEDIINLEREDLASVADIDAETVDVLMRMIDELTVEVDEEWDEETGEYVISEEAGAGGAEESGEIEAAAEIDATMAEPVAEEVEIDEDDDDEEAGDDPEIQAEAEEKPVIAQEVPADEGDDDGADDEGRRAES